MKKSKKEVIKLMPMKRIDPQKSIIKETKRNQENIKVIKRVMKLDILVKRIKVINQKYQIMIVNKFMVIINSIIKISGLLTKKNLKIRNMITNIAETKSINKKKNIRNRKTVTTNIVEIEENKTHPKSNRNLNKMERVLKNKLKMRMP